MNDFEQARIVMVDRQIRPSDVTDPRIIDAFLAVPREEFVPSSQRALAYMDEDIPLASADRQRYLMEPASLAKLIQLAGVAEDHIVLDVGCATGYSTAVLSQLCGSIVALESDESLATQASETLMRLAFDNAAVVTGDLSAGYAKEAPYDIIFVGGAVDYVPGGLIEQLKAGGHLVVVEGHGNTGNARVYLREGDTASARTAFNCAVMPLPGFAMEAAFEF
ncbi:MAG: protein-L-isoaspartate O-methyltransferase family protein [Rhizobiaceae bacterium]